uniref:Uncharacterized protein n=1 Tax=Arundo donax TaxID=35708 RepID=A0A0A9BLK3_ARUDO
MQGREGQKETTVRPTSA